MAAMNGPRLRDVVTLVVPRREQLDACVDDAAARWLDLTLLSSPRSSWQVLRQTQVAVHFSSAQGLCRLTGTLTQRPSDLRLRVTGYGAGEAVRLEHRGNVQLLRRPAEVRAHCNAQIVVLQKGGLHHVAAEGRCVAVSGDGLRLRALPELRAKDLCEFRVQLGPKEPAVAGEFVVERVDRDGNIDVRFTSIDGHARACLVRWAVDQTGARVVA